MAHYRGWVFLTLFVCVLCFTFPQETLGIKNSIPRVRLRSFTELNSFQTPTDSSSTAIPISSSTGGSAPSNVSSTAAPSNSSVLSSSSTGAVPSSSSTSTDSGSSSSSAASSSTGGGSSSSSSTASASSSAGSSSSSSAGSSSSSATSSSSSSTASSSSSSSTGSVPSSTGAQPFNFTRHHGGEIESKSDDLIALYRFERDDSPGFDSGKYSNSLRTFGSGVSIARGTDAKVGTGSLFLRPRKNKDDTDKANPDNYNFLARDRNFTGLNSQPSGQSSFTFTAWFKLLNPILREYGISHWGNLTQPVGRGVRIFTNGEARGYGGFSSNDTLSTPDFNGKLSSEWRHLAVTYNYKAANETIYLDGKLASSRTVPFTLNVDSNGFKLGVADGKPFHGYLDDVAIFNRTLTQREIGRVLDGVFYEYETVFNARNCQEFKGRLHGAGHKGGDRFDHIHLPGRPYGFHTNTSRECWHICAKAVECTAATFTTYDPLNSTVNTNSSVLPLPLAGGKCELIRERTGPAITPSNDTVSLTCKPVSDFVEHHAKLIEAVQIDESKTSSIDSGRILKPIEPQRKRKDFNVNQVRKIAREVAHETSEAVKRQLRKEKATEIKNLKNEVKQLKAELETIHKKHRTNREKLESRLSREAAKLKVAAEDLLASTKASVAADKALWEGLAAKTKLKKLHVVNPEAKPNELLNGKPLPSPGYTSPVVPQQKQFLDLADYDIHKKSDPKWEKLFESSKIQKVKGVNNIPLPTHYREELPEQFRFKQQKMNKDEKKTENKKQLDVELLADSPALAAFAKHISQTDPDF